MVWWWVPWVFWPRCRSWHPTSSIRALEGTSWSTDPSQWPSLILSSSTTRLLTERALFPSCQLSNARTSQLLTWTAHVCGCERRVLTVCVRNHATPVCLTLSQWNVIYSGISFPVGWLIVFCLEPVIRHPEQGDFWLVDLHRDQVEEMYFLMLLCCF